MNEERKHNLGVKIVGVALMIIIIFLVLQVVNLQSQITQWSSFNDINSTIQPFLDNQTYNSGYQQCIIDVQNQINRGEI